MSIPSGTSDFPLGLGIAPYVGGTPYILDALDLSDETTRTINRTNQNGDSADFQIRKAGEKITGTATLQRASTSTLLPKSDDTFYYYNGSGAGIVFYFGIVTDVKVSRSKDSADVFVVGLLLDYTQKTAKSFRVGNVGGLSSSNFYFAQGNMTGMGQTYNTSNLTNRLLGITSGTTGSAVAVIGYDANLTAGTTRPVTFRVAYPTDKIIGGTHSLTEASNLQVLSTETISGKKYSVVKVDATISNNTTIFVGIDFENE